MPAPNLSANLSARAKSWNLEGIDKGFEVRFLGQFIGENMQEGFGSVLGETSTVGKEKPDFQWLKGEAEGFSFDTKMYAENSTISIRQQLNILKSFGKRDKTLKRTPRALFTAGTEIALVVFLKSVRILYDELRDDGSLRGVAINITLQVIDEKLTKDAATALSQQVKFASGQIGAAAALFSKSARGLISIPGGSLHTIGRKTYVKYGDTFESIAKIEYGNALKGDILRRAQPQLEPLEAGDLVTLVEPSEIVQMKVTQQSVFLKNNQTNLNLRTTKLAQRNRSVVVVI